MFTIWEFTILEIAELFALVIVLLSPWLTLEYRRPRRIVRKPKYDALRQ
jgi:hypothetical protein